MAQEEARIATPVSENKEAAVGPIKVERKVSQEVEKAFLIIEGEIRKMTDPDVLDGKIKMVKEEIRVLDEKKDELSELLSKLKERKNNLENMLDTLRELQGEITEA